MWKRLPGGAEAGLSPEGVDILGEILQNACGYLPYATPWTAAYQAPLSMGFSRQGYWSGLPLPSPCESRSVISNSLQPHGLYCPWNSPGQNTGVGTIKEQERHFRVSVLSPFSLAQGSFKPCSTQVVGHVQSGL